MSMPSTYAVNERTSPSPWPGRILRISLALIGILLWLAASRFITFELAGDSSYSNDNVPRCMQQLTSSSRADIVEFINSNSHITINENFDRVPNAYGALDYWMTENITLDQHGSQFHVVIESRDGCTWTDSFNASFQSYAIGHLLGLFALVVAGAALILLLIILYGIFQGLYWLWNGEVCDFTDDEDESATDECRDPACGCIEHTAPVFDERHEEWDYHDCDDTGCTCADHGKRS